MINVKANDMIMDVHMFHINKMCLRRHTDIFVGVSDYQPQCLRLPIFWVKWGTFADFKKMVHFKENETLRPLIGTILIRID